jgi:hypothetical protein
MSHVSRVVVACWLAAAATAQEATEKLSAADAKTAVQDFCFGDAKKKAAARAKLEKVRPEDRKGIFAAFATAKFKPPAGAAPPKGGRLVESLDLPESPLGKGKFIALLPPKYDPAKPWPLVFRLHGSGDDCEAFAKTWTGTKAVDECVALVPEIPSEDRMAWNRPGAQQFVDRLYAYALRRFNVDTDRVYFTGHSAGSGASLILSGVWPERVAGIYGTTRLYVAFDPDWRGSLEVVRNIPGYFAVGLKDTEERIKGYRDAEAFAKETKAPWVFHYLPNRGHEYFKEHDQPAFETLLKHKRARYPREFSALFFGYSNSDANDLFKKQHWLRAETFDPGRGTPCRVSVKDNVVTIDAPRLVAGSLLLNDELVKMDETVVVMLDGKEVFRGTVDRDVKFLLDGFDAVPDPRRLFWNELPFKR